MTRTIILQLPDEKVYLEKKFLTLCESLSPDEVPSIRLELKQTVARLHEFKDSFLGPHLGLVAALAKAANSLLDRYEAFSDEQRGQVIGAVRYFILAHDAASDTTAISGLDDDVIVMNGVLVSVGLADEQIATLVPLAAE